MELRAWPEDDDVERSLTCNSALYYEDWRDIQISFRNTNSQVYVTNAGDARSYGWENEIVPAQASLGVQWRPVPRARPAQHRQSRRPKVGRLSPQAGDIRRDEGRRAAGRPKNLNGSFGVQYNIANIWNGSAYLRVDELYVGKSCVDFTCDGSLKIGDYSLVNLRASYKIRNYEFVAFADNVVDSDGVASVRERSA